MSETPRFVGIDFVAHQDGREEGTKQRQIDQDRARAFYAAGLKASKRFGPDLPDAIAAFKVGFEETYSLEPAPLDDEHFARLMDAATLAGQLEGDKWRTFGSNVAMSFFEAGEVWASYARQLTNAQVDQRLKAAFFDGFAKTYWVDVTEQQKAGPYT